jgi:hypothetical protein
LVKIKTPTFFEFSKFFSNEMPSLSFSSWLRWKHIGGTTFIGEISTAFRCGPLCFLLVHWLIPIGSIVLAPKCFSKLLKGYLRVVKEIKTFLRSPPMGISYSLKSTVDNVLNRYWSMLT